MKKNTVTIKVTLIALVIFGYSLEGRSYKLGSSFKNGIKADQITSSEIKSEFTVSGVVKSDDGEALPGVSVSVKGTTIGTITDKDGKYSLIVPDEKGTLLFSFIGKAPEEMAINGQSMIDIVLLPDIFSLNEIIVVGYGTQKKSDLTGSVSSVSIEEMKSQPMASIEQGLQGRAAGVQVIQTSGAPGAPISMRIRGGNSINAGNEPLFVVDGFPGIGDLTSINPNDIESISVLKDASATAIYGARGANGVVLITTKRGKSGKPAITFDTYYGVQKLSKKLDLLNAQQYATLFNEASINSGKAAIFTNEEIAAMGKGTDWQDELFRTAPISNYQLSVSGGNETNRYAISGNYFNQQGIVKNSGFDRYSFRINTDSDLNDKLKIGTNLTFSRTNNNGVETADDGRGVVSYALQFTPLASVYNTDGSFNMTDISQVDVRGNPVARALATTNRRIGNRLLGNVFAEYNLLKNLVFRTSLGADISFSKNNLYVPSTIYEGAATKGRASISSDLSTGWLNENTLTYTKNINELHDITLLGGYTMQEMHSDTARASSQRFGSDALKYNNLSLGDEPQAPSSGTDYFRLISYLARANYGFKNKYLLTLTARVDGSSRFGSGNKYAFFPSGSVAWRISEESFMKNQNTITDLKLRASYGLTGNQEISSYQSLSSLGVTRYVFGSGASYKPVVGLGSSRVANPDLKWETTSQFDVGVDIGILANRINLTADFYYKKTSDLLLSIPLPLTSGYAQSLKNIGVNENKGVELSIAAKILTGNIKWNTSANFSANRNKILDLGDVDFFLAGNSSGAAKLGESGIVKVGESVGSMYGIVSDGIFQTDDEATGYVATITNPDGTTKNVKIQPTAKAGDRRFIDQNKDGSISANDRVIIGRAQPKFIGGFNNTFSYKGFELNIFLQGVYGNSNLNLIRPIIESTNGNTNQSTSTLDRWTPLNPSNKNPRALLASTSPNLINDIMVADASYLRVKVITLGYNLPSNLFKGAIKNSRIYVTANNPFTFTNYTGYDPEVNTFGKDRLSLNTDFGAYPNAKSILVGLTVGL